MLRSRRKNNDKEACLLYMYICLCIHIVWVVIRKTWAFFRIFAISAGASGVFSPRKEVESMGPPVIRLDAAILQRFRNLGRGFEDFLSVVAKRSCSEYIHT